MKRIFYIIVALAAISSCMKENMDVASTSIPEETIILTAKADQTKTVFGENHTSVEWESDDALSVILKNAEGTFSKNTKFSKATEKNAFSGVFKPVEEGPSTEGLNTYYAMYPYDGSIESIDPVSGFLKTASNEDYLFEIPAIQNQTGISNMGHLHVPLLGAGTVEGKNRPSVRMNHLVSIIKVSLKNEDYIPVIVKSVKITVDGEAKLNGKFKINSKEAYPLIETSESTNSAQLEVGGGTLASQSIGDFYLMFSEFELGANAVENMKIEIETDLETIVVEKKAQNKIFKAGTIVTIPVTFKRYTPQQLFMVDAASHLWSMKRVEGAHFVTGENTLDIVPPFKFAEKVQGNAIDYSGKVWGLKNGKVAEIGQDGTGLPLDPAFSQYNTKPNFIGVDIHAAKVVCRQVVPEPTWPFEGRENETVVWVQTLPNECEVIFDGFNDVNISEILDPSLFTDIDNVKKTAKYLGSGDNFELHYKTDKKWLLFMNMISKEKMIVIGHHAAIGMAKDLSIPIIDATISTVPGQAIILYKRNDAKWYGSIYAQTGFGGSLYNGFGWGNMIQGFTSGDNNIKVNDGMWLGTGSDFQPGLQIICYDPATKIITMNKIVE